MTPPADLLILVRHAQTVPDPSVPSDSWRLSDDADVACRRLANELRELRPDRVLTSTHVKAWDTGRRLAAHLHIPCEALPGLEEHDRTGVPFVPDDSQWFSLIERLFSRPDEVVLGNESASQASRRFRKALVSEVQRRPEDRLIVVSHATVMALLIAESNDLDPFRFWRTIRMPDAFVLELPELRLLSQSGIS